MRKYSIVRASANEFGGTMQMSALMSTNDRGSKFFGIDHGVVDVREDLELVGDADVVAVRRQPVRDDAGAHLAILERLDHAVLARHLLDPPVGLDGHSSVGNRSRRRQQWPTVDRQRRNSASTSVRITLSTIDVTSGK